MHIVSVHQCVPIHSTYIRIVPLNTLCCPRHPLPFVKYVRLSIHSTSWVKAITGAGRSLLWAPLWDTHTKSHTYSTSSAILYIVSQVIVLAVCSFTGDCQFVWSLTWLSSTPVCKNDSDDYCCTVLHRDLWRKWSEESAMHRPKLWMKWPTCDCSVSTTTAGNMSRYTIMCTTPRLNSSLTMHSRLYYS